MAYGTLNTDIVQSSTAGTPPQFNDGNGTQTGTLCRAWINYNGISKTIVGSFNVSSVTYVGTGIYTINFTNAMADANYGISFGVGTNNGSIQATIRIQNTPTASACSVFAGNASQTAQDTTQVCVSIFR